ncbi:MAG: hypothetical protein K0S80_2786 [Neobacillus sp.]|nr:hypothetical protein [Neobacillus sp.]
MIWVKWGSPICPKPGMNDDLGKVGMLQNQQWPLTQPFNKKWVRFVDEGL